MDALLEGLNSAQKSAVTSPSAVLQVLAPPGSGKTKTLTARVAYLVNHERLQPWNIVVCTFTIKAAREMKERIRGFVGDGIESKLILGTFHSVARRFLVRYGQEIGIDKTFGIADSSDSAAIIKRIVARSQYAVEPSMARSRISGLKSKGITSEHFVATLKQADQHEFANVYSEYEEQLKASNLLDYDDLLLRCTDLLRGHPACVSSIQAVLIDEYQDTNNVQYELMKLMAQARNCITIVGDPDQSIYSFRSAEIKNLLRMRDDYPESIVINLENNYRSSGCILTSALAVIEQDESRPSKPLLATHCVGEQPTLRHLATAYIEAQWIVDEILRSRTLTAGLLDFSDYAILVRSAALSLHIEKALSKAGVPYRMVGGLRFFDRAEIKIILDYLRVINQPDHNDALVRIINVPPRRIGDVTVKALLEEAETKKISLWNLVLNCARGKTRPATKISSVAQKGIDMFVNLILTSRKKLLPADGEQCNLLELLEHVFLKIQFKPYLEEKYKDSWRERWENVEELAAQTTQIVAGGSDAEEGGDDALPVVEGIEQRKDTAADILSKFLANVALSTEVEKKDGETPNQVTISTIHAAKGLEWPIVFIPAVYDGCIPHSRAEDHDEERRLLYVGMTRAQALLYLSCPVKQSNGEETKLSKFISSRSIQKSFSSKGPSIGCSVLQDLAQILRRPTPSKAEVDIALTLLEHIEDDRFPLQREHLDGEAESWEVSTSGRNKAQAMSRSDAGPGSSFKRRKLEPATTVGVTVTTHTAAFSVSSTTMHSNSGFTSASTHHKILQEAKAIAQLVSAPTLDKRRAAFGEDRKTETKTGSKKGLKSRPAGQGSITSFFGRSASNLSDRSDTAAVVPERAPAAVRSLSSIPQYTLGDSKDSIRPQPAAITRSYQAPAVSSHRPRNIPLTGKPKRSTPEPESRTQKYILLSSSPVKAEEELPGEALDFSDVENKVSLSTSPIKHFSNNPMASASRPASTFHSTSMGQLQGPIGAPRKTLGMRRSHQGWASSSKSFRPPRPHS